MPNSISENKIEEIVNANDIIDVIGEFVSLKKAGTSYTALCPFHKEKTPSFTVTQDKQIFHCFGCGAGGDSITFLMKYKNFSFIETVEYLADRVGIKIDKAANPFDDNKLDINYEINKEAAIYYYKELNSNINAVNYVIIRGIDNSSRKLFGLGFAPDKWDGILTHLKLKGYNEIDIEKNGLIVKGEKNNHYYDRFRNRIIFPIIDLKKRVIGFGGRVLDNTLPKYINSPDSTIFNKGKNLYNLNNAREFLKNEPIILTEGYMDVIKLSINGYNNVVASLGTALTENQVKLMKKYSKEFLISYDSDNAGLKAALKAANLLKKSDLKCKILIFPEKMDPDEYVSKYGAAKYKERIDKAFDYFEFLDYYFSSIYDIKTDKGKLEYIKEMNINLVNINNAIEKELCIEKIARKTGITKESINTEYMKKNRSNFKNENNIINKIDLGENIPNDFEVELIDIMKSSIEIVNFINQNYGMDIFKDTLHRSEFNDILLGKSYEKNNNFKLKNIHNTQEELLNIAKDYINKIIIESNKKLRTYLAVKLKNDQDSEYLKAEISKIDKEILRLRGL